LVPSCGNVPRERPGAGRCCRFPRNLIAGFSIDPGHEFARAAAPAAARRMMNGIRKMERE